MSGPQRFERLRPRTPEARRSVRNLGETPPDAEGKRALFTVAEGTPASGSMSVECSRCGETTVLSAGQAVRMLMWPSLHLGLAFARRDGEATLAVARREHPSYAKCPACGRRSWVRLVVRV